MGFNSFGKRLVLTTFGESHGMAVGGVLDGFPPGFSLDLEAVQYDLNRRKPGQSDYVSPRKEDDELIIFSGLFEGKTTGAPIAFMVNNKNQEPKDYEHLKNVYRPSHSDFTYQKKYGIRDHRGSGRASARETLARVAAGSMAAQFLKTLGISFQAFVKQIGPHGFDEVDFPITSAAIEANPMRCPHPETASKMMAYIEALKQSGDTTGGIIACFGQGIPVGLGEPVYEKFHARLAFAMMSINAAKGFEMGSGFAGAIRKGSEENDSFGISENKVVVSTNHSGGIQGGISNGADIHFKVAFKPVSTIKKEQQSVSAEDKEISFIASGRHDPCVLPRAVPVVEAMAQLVTLDFYLTHLSHPR
jgi:chorismate synthase